MRQLITRLYRSIARSNISTRQLNGVLSREKTDWVLFLVKKKCFRGIQMRNGRYSLQWRVSVICYLCYHWYYCWCFFDIIVDIVIAILLSLFIFVSFIVSLLLSFSFDENFITIVINIINIFSISDIVVSLILFAYYFCHYHYHLYWYWYCYCHYHLCYCCYDTTL